ncbi:MAG TPA: hypothetical protein VFS10_04500 [Pyrinomonadaceae bacterium]|nr:hypothetical protein [Pyrinomonadaceae bacterium]
MKKTVAPRGRRKSRKSLYISLAVIAVIILLLWQEQVALLYVLATLSVAGLLTVVAFADLRGARQSTAGPAPFDDSAAIADGTTGVSSPATTTSSTAVPRPRKR